MTPIEPVIDERAKLAFQFASDLAKQLITISTALIAFSATFTKDLVKKDSPKRYLYAALAAHLLAIIFGVMTLMALTGTLMPKGGYSKAVVTEFGSNVTIPATIQIALFVIGCALLVVHGVAAIRRRGDDAPVFE